MNASSLTLRNASSRKYKAACDHCHSSKVKCPGGGPPCKRCADTNQQCHYSLAARIGKPPGSKNKKTLEKFYRPKSNDTREIVGGGGGGDANNEVHKASDNGCDRMWDGEVERRGSDNVQNPFEIGQKPISQPLSPLIDYLGFLDPSQSPNPGMQDILDDRQELHIESSDDHVLHSTELGMAQFEALSKTDEPTPWEDAMNDGWSVSTAPCSSSTIADL